MHKDQLKHLVRVRSYRKRLASQCTDTLCDTYGYEDANARALEMLEDARVTELEVSEKWKYVQVHAFKKYKNQ